MCEKQEATLEERYEMLKSLCKQQIMINEVLKSEIGKLSTIIQNISRERSVLLDELIANHSSCQSASKDYLKASRMPTSDSVTKRAAPTAVGSVENAKHPKRESSVMGEYEDDLSTLTDHFPLEMAYSQDLENHWTSQDREITQSHRSLMHSTSLMSPTVASKGRLHYQITQVRATTNQSMPVFTESPSTGANSCFPPPPDSNFIQKANSPNSPPAITASTQFLHSTSVNSMTQRPSKLASLVTNSTVCSTSSSIPFVSFTSQRPPGPSVQPKYVTVANRSVKVVGSGINNASSSTHGISSNSILKSVTSPPLSPGLRLSSSSTNSRIMIQPGNGTAVRSIFVPRSQTHPNDSTCEITFSKR